MQRTPLHILIINFAICFPIFPRTYSSNLFIYQHAVSFLIFLQMNTIRIIIRWQLTLSKNFDFFFKTPFYTTTLAKVFQETSILIPSKKFHKIFVCFLFFKSRLNGVLSYRKDVCIHS